MPDYTNENVKREAKRILAEAIRYIDGDTVKPVTDHGTFASESDVLMMVADATGVSDYFHVE